MQNSTDECLSSLVMIADVLSNLKEADYERDIVDTVNKVEHFIFKVYVALSTSCIDAKNNFDSVKKETRSYKQYSSVSQSFHSFFKNESRKIQNKREQITETITSAVECLVINQLNFPVKKFKKLKVSRKRKSKPKITPENSSTKKRKAAIRNKIRNQRRKLSRIYCNYCREHSHLKESCPVLEKKHICEICSEKGHFEKNCSKVSFDMTGNTFTSKLDEKLSHEPT